MSTGRHAKRRAARTQENLVKEQEAQLNKEERIKDTMNADIENQRIATMRARFGGQAPEVQSGGNTASMGNNFNQGETVNKFKTPTRLKKNDPMKQTIMGMMLGNTNNNNGANQ